MNYLGHPFVAHKVTGRFNRYLLAGSFLPDLSPFVPDSVFAYEEIHEGGEKLFEFLKRKHPDKIDLAVGMLSHAYKFGADSFSKGLEKRFESERESLVKRIMEATPNISYEAASKGRFHNFLWWGVDVQILENEPEFVEKLKQTLPLINKGEAARILSECFGKGERDVLRMLDFLLLELTEENSSSIQGLVKIWKHIASGLPERDEVNEKKTEGLFIYCSNLVKSSSREILNEAIQKVRTNLEPFI